ncbi:DNA polymerase-3 subunit epsilon [Polynucleobacter meluiroseus]|uniref:Excinuclease cho n=1 Tax=Polynucleobacter meluiroseus TaxID=1938814 RepID=A0A240DZF2_9BURK|nr:3'-5' exonuclease family protein [Polynucleobacter meluiroseus]SNX28064.1 DNA polymerase-3 subunit epsilon [Polynucleobacter meluiroseus]
MKNASAAFPTLAFVDIETTGSHYDRDRITEVGIKTLYPNQAQVEIWESLLNPQVFIPQNIQKLTGISPQMVEGQPDFSERAHELHRQLENKVFVAHNARFDYGFLKASFKRIGIDFKPKVLCTVKLSRHLFPEQKRHNLDTLIQVHDLQVSARHRALGDADLLLQFWKICEARFGAEKMLAAIDHVTANTSLPTHIDKDLVNQIPASPGVYIFYAENKMPLYIGKSIDMRARVLSHFQGTLTDRKEIKLSLQIRDIDWIETSGELGALLLESQLIKERLPSMNIKLRRSKDLCAWQLQEGEAGALAPALVTHRDLLPGLQENLYGLFYSRREAQQCLTAIAKRNQLCGVVLGLEKRVEQKPCFAYQVKQCKGACIGAESIATHNLRLKLALEAFRVKSWPYAGPIAIAEGEQMHVIDRWCYLGSAINQDELEELSSEGEAEFDLDIYKILKKKLSSIPSSQIVHLTRP